MPRKLIGFHSEDFRALEQLADDKSSTVQEMVDEAVRDLLTKYDRPTDLREALKRSASADDKPAPRRRPRPRLTKRQRH